MQIIGQLSQDDAIKISNAIKNEENLLSDNGLTAKVYQYKNYALKIMRNSDKSAKNQTKLEKEYEILKLTKEIGLKNSQTPIALLKAGKNKAIENEKLLVKLFKNPNAPIINIEQRILIFRVAVFAGNWQLANQELSKLIEILNYQVFSGNADMKLYKENIQQYLSHYF